MWLIPSLYMNQIKMAASSASESAQRFRSDSGQRSQCKSMRREIGRVDVGDRSAGVSKKKQKGRR